MNIAVLGAGSWGTALTIVLARNGHDVTLIGRNQEELSILRSHRENLRYLPGFAIPSEVRFEDFDHVPEAVEMTVVAVPSSAVRSSLKSLQGQHPVVVAASKGLEPLTAALMADVIEEVIPTAQVGVLSGPNLAVEIVRGVPTAAVAASLSEPTADLIRRTFMSRKFRVYASNDVIGVELAGALKNVLAMGAGMSDGLGFGDNTKAVLMARGLKEMIALGCAMGARIETFLGIAGVGDLFATAASELSRNYRLGRSLAEGKSVNDALKTLGQVAEGVQTSEAVIVLANKFQVRMPIFEAIDAVVRGKLVPSLAVELLMERDTRDEGFAWLKQS